MKSSRIVSVRLLLAALAGAVLLATSGCASYFGTRERAHESSSVVAYLYPKEENPTPPTSIPVLRLPLRVGILFVPPAGTKGQAYYRAGGGVTELQKAALLERVAKEFRGRDFIESIEIVPSSYLRPGGGFANLDQLRGLLNIDVAVLVAYDQVQFTSENVWSLAYWTIVGAYIVHGNKNDTHTLMEAAVYDIASRHLLFRAPGANQTGGGTSLVDVDDKLRRAGGQSMDLATADLIKNLDTELGSFRERAKANPGTLARIEHKPGYAGGGSVGAGFGLACAGLLGAWGWRRRG